MREYIGTYIFYRISFFSAIILGLFLGGNIQYSQAAPIAATTTVNISICGDGLVGGGEVCDDGAVNNDGGYGASIAARRCLPDCQGYGAYCGDTIVHFLYSEECDDGNNSDGDRCSSVCTNEESPINTTDGGGTTVGESGAGGQIVGTIPIKTPTRVSVSGKAYPSSVVHILKDGKEISTALANASGDFSKDLTGVSPGSATFGFWADDGSGLRSITFTTTFQVTESAVTTVSGVYIPPTIEGSDTAVSPGESITFSGNTIPNALVTLYVDGGTEYIATTTSSGAGAWEIEFDTRPLSSEAFHTAKAAFSLGEGFTGGSGEGESGFGQTINFYVGQGDGADAFFADLNVDGKVNIVDFSILLFNWGTSGGTATPPPDINRDGTVNLTDFSIMIFYWTG
jgi:cysteine-rich repeat protein